MNTLYETKDQWMLKEWFKRKSPSEQQQYIATLINRPPAFYNRFDFDVMGVKLSNRATNWLDYVSNENSAIAERVAEAEFNGEDFSSGYLHEKVDRWVSAHLGKDKSFDAAIEAMNSWGWGVFQPEAGYADQKGKAGFAWQAIQTYVSALSDAAVERDFHGDDYKYAQPDDKQFFVQARYLVGEYIKELADWSPAFGRQVVELQRGALRGDQLQSYLVPSVYFPTGRIDS